MLKMSDSESALEPILNSADSESPDFRTILTNFKNRAGADSEPKYGSKSGCHQNYDDHRPTIV